MALAASSSSLPHIDLTRDPKTLEPGTQEWDLASRAIRESLESYGGFLVSYDKISGEEREEMFAAMESLFALPLETRRKLEGLPGFLARYPGQNPFPGKNPFSPLQQSLGIVDAHKPEKAQAFTDLMWSDGNDNFRQTINSMGQKMQDLACILMKMIFNSFGLERCCESYIDNMDPLFQMIRYPASMADEPTVGFLEHVDATFLTILFQNEVNGLLTKTRKEEWIQVTPEKGTFVVQIGLPFKAWSNGHLHVPPHKVSITENKVRFTCGLFLHAKLEHVVETPNENVDEEHPRMFKPFQFGEFYKSFRARGAAEDSLDVFADI